MNECDTQHNNKQERRGKISILHMTITGREKRDEKNVSIVIRIAFPLVVEWHHLPCYSKTTCLTAMCTFYSFSFSSHAMYTGCLKIFHFSLKINSLSLSLFFGACFKFFNKMAISCNSIPATWIHPNNTFC